jgi:hypothetical protein
VRIHHEPAGAPSTIGKGWKWTFSYIAMPLQGGECVGDTVVAFKATIEYLKYVALPEFVHSPVSAPLHESDSTSGANVGIVCSECSGSIPIE